MGLTKSLTASYLTRHLRVPVRCTVPTCIKRLRDNLGHDYMDVGGTSPWTGEGRTMQEQLSRITSGTVIETTVVLQIVEEVPGNHMRGLNVEIMEWRCLIQCYA